MKHRRSPWHRAALAFCACLAARAARAQSFGAPDDYLQSGIGARAMGMGGAFSALADDVTAGVYNPAGLSLLRSNEVQFMHAPYFFDTNLDYLGGAFPVTPSLAVGFSGVFLRTGGIEARDAFNQPQGTGNASNSAYIVSISGRVGDFNVGASAKMFNQSVLGNSGSALAADLGLLYSPVLWARTALVLQNINEPSIRLLDTPDVFRTRYKIGEAVMVPGYPLTLTADYTTSQSGQGQLTGGAEIKMLKYLMVRGGLDNQTNPNFGFGVSSGRYQFDYGFAKTQLGALNRFSFTVRFGQLFRLQVRPVYEVGQEAVVLGASMNQVAFRVDQPRYPVEWWKLIIRDRDGSVVREIQGMGAPQPTFWWDLRDTLGRPVHDGVFPFEFQVKYKGGDVWSESGEIRTVNQFQQEEPVQMNIHLEGGK